MRQASSRADFRFEPERDLYICPRGNALKTTGKVHDGRTLLYRASKHHCDPCPVLLPCCPKAPARKIPRAMLATKPRATLPEASCRPRATASPPASGR